MSEVLLRFKFKAQHSSQKVFVAEQWVPLFYVEKNNPLLLHEINSKFTIVILSHELLRPAGGSMKLSE